MKAAEAIADWLRELNEFERRPGWIDDHAGLAVLYERKAATFDAMAAASVLPWQAGQRAECEAFAARARAHAAEHRAKLAGDISIPSFDCAKDAHSDCEGYGAGGDPAHLSPCSCPCHASGCSCGSPSTLHDVACPLAAVETSR